MKTILLSCGLLIFTCSLYSCGSKNDPTPSNDNSDTGGTTGTPTGTGGTTDTTKFAPEYQYGVVVGNITALDSLNHPSRSTYTFAGEQGGTVDLINGGNIACKIVNLDKGVITEFFNNFSGTPNEKPSNISTGLSTAANPADTAINVYIEITDPAAMDAITKRPIIKRYFMRDDGGSDAGSFGFVRGKDFTVKEANSVAFITTALNRNNYKFLK